MGAAGLAASELERVEVHPAGSERAVRLLVDADGRTGCGAVWTAAVTAAVGLSHALVAASLPAGGEAVLCASVALRLLFLDPLARLADARPGVLVCEARGGAITVQAPTSAHRELAAACCGGEAERWRDAVRAWANGRPAGEAAAELQDFGVPAFVVGEQAAEDREGGPVGPVPAAGDESPLAGVTVIELGGLWAAPLAAQLLAGLGTHVLKIEAPMRPDGARNGPAAHFNALNRGKTALMLDLRRPGDRDRFVSLLGPKTVVIENFSLRVLGNLGLLQAIDARDAALIRLPASRRHPDWRGLGSSLELAAGLGRPDSAGALTCAPIPLTDPLSGLVAALHAVAAMRGGTRLRVVGQLEDVAGVMATIAAAA